MNSRRVILASALFLSCGQALAGPLDPPAGAPAPTFKTLAEVEPRRAVQSLPGNSAALHVITEPGSYYLTGNIQGVSGKSAIVIAASNVTIDLAGFTISGVEGGSSSGIRAPEAQRSIRVMSGTIENWPIFGVGLSDVASAEVTNVTVRNCSGGIWVGTDSRIHACRVTGSSQIGISGKAGVVITDCTARSCTNTGIHTFATGAISNCTASQCGTGFGTQGTATLSGCVAESSTSHGFQLWVGNTARDCTAIGSGGNGFQLGDYSTAENCSSRNNTAMGFLTGSGVRLTNCTAGENQAGGAQVGEAAVVTGCTFFMNENFGLFLSSNLGVASKCTASRNHGDGIRVNTGSQVTENSCFANAGATATFAGIRAIGPSNRIEANILHQNGTGVIADVGGNMIIRNSFSFNSIRINAVQGNNVAQMVVVPGNNFVSTDPQANLAY
jgi:hypothetical protein